MGHLRTAPPPIHSVSFVVIFLAICLKSLPSMSSIDEVATIDAFTNTATDFVGLKSVAIARLLFAVFGVATSIYDYFFGSLTVNTKYHPRSKLVCVPFELKGWKKNIFFTNLMWNMLTVSFCASGFIAWFVANGQEDLIHANPWLLRVALLAYEIAVPNEFLVASVVTYVLWGNMLDRGDDALRKPVCLVMHNAGIFMILAEVLFLGRIPLPLAHIVVTAIFGCFYVFFTWYMSDKWTPGAGPQFVYEFMDTTMGMRTTYVILALLGALSFFYTLISLLNGVITDVESFWVKIVLGGFICRFTCRFRD